MSGPETRFLEDLCADQMKQKNIKLTFGGETLRNEKRTKEAMKLNTLVGLIQAPTPSAFNSTFSLERPKKIKCFLGLM